MRLLSLLPVFFFPLTFALHVNIPERGITRTSAFHGPRSDELGHALQRRQAATAVTGIIQVYDPSAGERRGFVSNLHALHGVFELTTDRNEAMKVAFSYVPEGLFTVVNANGDGTYPFVAAISGRLNDQISSTDESSNYAYFGGSAQSTAVGGPPAALPNSLAAQDKPVETSIFLFTPSISGSATQGHLSVVYFHADGDFHMPTILHDPANDAFMISTSGSNGPSAADSNPPGSVAVSWSIV